jgi:glycine oxidase
MSMKRHDDSAPPPSNQPIWELGGDERLLDPGPGVLGGRYDVLVVGGGVIGLATSALCRRAGLGRVAVMERGRLAAGPSGRGAGILAPALHRGTDPECLFRFGHASLSMWSELDREWDGALGVQPLDVLLTHRAEPPPSPRGAGPGPEPEATPAAPPAGAPQPAPERASGTEVLGLERASGTEVLGPEAARGVEPQLAAGRAGVLLRDQARVDPLGLAVALARRAGTVATRVEVTGIQDAGSGGVRVRTGQGDLRAGAVVLATGSAPAIRGLPAPSGQLLVKGTLLTTTPAPLRLRVGVAGRGGLVLQLPDGRLLFGNTFDLTDRSSEVRAETLAATRADLEALIPGAAGLPLSNAWTCFRPATAGGLPVIDKVDGLDRVWTTYGHFRSGFLLAAATGQALANWISNGERPDQVAAFSAGQPSRATGPYLD